MPGMNLMQRSLRRAGWRDAGRAVVLAALSCSAGFLACGTDSALPESPELVESPTASAGMPSQAVSWEGGSLSMADVLAPIADDLRRMDIAYHVERHELVQSTLDRLLDERLLAEAARRRGLGNVEALIAEQVDGTLAEPSEEVLREGYERFRKQVPSATSFEAARPYLVNELRQAAREARRAEFVRALRQQAGAQVHLPFPDLPRVAVAVDVHDPTVGPTDAPVTIVQFGGYQCYYCKRVHETVLDVLARYPGRVRLVYKDFPLAGHERAHDAAIAAHCADQQGRFLDMGALLLDNQGWLQRDHLHGYATRLGLDLDAWQQCMDDPVWRQRIEEDVHAGRVAGVTSTPTFFVNGLMLVGAHDVDRFVQVIEQELSRRSGG